MTPLPDLKGILHSKRANIYYLEHCRVMQKDGRVLYLTEAKKENAYWNIPIANTTVILLGSGTSVTQAAMRMLASAGVLVGFCGGGATPLLAANEVEWLTPQSEYRPTEYIQGWMQFWFDPEKRLKIAKQFQVARLHFIHRVWQQDKQLKAFGIDSNNKQIANLINTGEKKIHAAADTVKLLQIEGQLTKTLYSFVAKKTGHSQFVRNHESYDEANVFLNHGNYLAYGLGATTLWVLGIPHGFAVMHGKTRRGALVFDVADLIKDALILPWAFVCANQQFDESAFRQQCVEVFTQYKALDFMFEQVKQAALKNDWGTSE